MICMTTYLTPEPANTTPTDIIVQAAYHAGCIALSPSSFATSSPRSDSLALMMIR